jgi:two-component system sensor kinase FixL
VKRLQLVAQVFAQALARKRAGRALRESEERVALAAEAAELGLWVWNIAGDEVWGSPKWRHLFGFTSGELVGFQQVIQRIHPDDRGTVEREVRRAVAERIDYAGEFRALLPDGTQRWVLSRGRGQGDASGTPARMLGAAIDVTERKRTEAALRASEARLAAGTELAALGYYEIDYAERTAFMDDRFGEICGIPAELAQGFQAVEFWFKHLHTDDLPLISQERQKLHDGNVDRIALEYRYRHPTQGQRWLHHSARVASRRTGGGGIRTFGVIRDITQQKEAELEAKGLRSNLAHADRVTLLGQLASSLAHELSQPLGAILRNAEAAEIILQAASPDLEELRAIVTDILRDDKRAGLVIDRLRSLLKRRSLVLQPIELSSVIAEVLSLVQADAAARHMKLAYSAAPGLPVVRGDRIHLQQVLLNLLVNAMDALEGCASNARSIQVSAHRTNLAMVEVRVSDNGPGIASDSFGQLFEPFFTTKAKGMGMGLAVSKTIVEAHQGRLWAENRPEGGACFCFTVPVPGGAGGRGA